MYLAKIILGKSQAARLKLRDAYAWHQKLWEGFPDRDGERRDFLFRIDDDGRDFRAFLLSDSEPVPPEWGCWESKKVSGYFLEHDVYRFQIRANPTMRRNSDRRRLGIYQQDRLEEWFQRKAGQHGFEMQKNALDIGGPTDEYFHKKGRRGKHVSVDFRGLLNVTDREKFKDAFKHGIGSAKAFGFGMLMLQPLK